MDDTIITLPEELWCMIFEELWLATPDAGTNLLPSANHSLDLFAEAKHRPPPWGPTMEIPPPAHGLPLWLLTSKTVMRKGVAAFNRIGRVYMSTPQPFFGCDEDDKKYDETAERKSWYNPGAFSSILKPEKWRRLFLFFDWPQYQIDPAQRRPLVDWDVKDVAYCRDLFADIGKSEVMKELEFRFTASACEAGSVYAVDFKPLAALVGGVAGHLVRLDVFLEIEKEYVVGVEEEKDEEELLALEKVRGEIEVLILDEVRKLSEVLRAKMRCNAAEGIDGTRLWGADSEFRGWRLLWTL